MTDVIGRISALMEKRHYTTYQLAKRSGLSLSTISNMFRRQTIPSIPTLEAICQCFGITLSQFFSEDGEQVELTAAELEFYQNWSQLNPTQKELLDQLIHQFK